MDLIDARGTKPLLLGLAEPLIAKVMKAKI